MQVVSEDTMCELRISEQVTEVVHKLGRSFEIPTKSLIGKPQEGARVDVILDDITIVFDSRFADQTEFLISKGGVVFFRLNFERGECESFQAALLLDVVLAEEIAEC